MTKSELSKKRLIDLEMCLAVIMTYLVHVEAIFSRKSYMSCVLQSKNCQFFFFCEIHYEIMFLLHGVIYTSI